MRDEYLPFLSGLLLEDGQIDRPIQAVIRKGKGHYVCDERLEQRLGPQQVSLGPETAGKGADVLHAQGHAEHLAGRLRQLVGLVYDQDAGIRQDGPAPAAPVDGVRQQQIVVADMEEKRAC